MSACVSRRISSARAAHFTAAAAAGKRVAAGSGAPHRRQIGKRPDRRHGDPLRLIRDGRINPSFVGAHRVPLDKGPEMYKVFRDKQHGGVTVMPQPNGAYR